MTAQPLRFLLFLPAFVVASVTAQTTGSTNERSAAAEPKNDWTGAPLDQVRAAADQGQAAAAFELFVRYNHGTDVIRSDAPPDPQSVEWLGKAAQAGHAYAQCLFGWYNANAIGSDGYNSHSNNMPAAVHWFRLSADQNWAGAQYNLAFFYLEGYGVERDEALALDLMRKAADQGHRYALYKLSELYVRGIGEPRSANDRPLQLLLRLAKGDYQEAFEPLSFRYQHGLGTERDLVKAAQWYCRASQPRPALFPLLGKALELTSDKARAAPPLVRVLFWYTRAARKEPAALEQIGDLYLVGADVPKSPVSAWVWFTLASQQGGASASTKLSTLEPKLTREELAETKDLLPEITQSLKAVASALQQIARDQRHES